MSTKSGKDWINASWHTARVPLPVSESVLIFARLCFKLVIQFLFAGREEACRFICSRVFILDHPNKSSKIQFSPPLTDCFLVTNQIIYTHGEQGTLTSKGFNSRQLLEDVKETQNLKLLRSEHNKEVRGRMQFILERVLPMVVKFFYNVSSGYTWTIYTLKAFPVRGVHRLREKKMCRPQLMMCCICCRHCDCTLVKSWVWKVWWFRLQWNMEMMVFGVYSGVTAILFSANGL